MYTHQFVVAQKMTEYHLVHQVSKLWRSCRDIGNDCLKRYINPLSRFAISSSPATGTFVQTRISTPPIFEHPDHKLLDITEPLYQSHLC